jgi:glyoxylase-like metal-dependent hydrolase (beta-lactamase superfamily II)
MPAFICTACGTEFPPRDNAPDQCPICADERQYVPVGGQCWTTLNTLANSRRNSFCQYEPGVIGIGTEPAFAIGQRALLVCTPAGNVLWDCITYLDAATITLINGLGGLTAIAISHPHFYTTMGQWSRAFGDVPIHLHGRDKAWIMQPNPAVQLWEGDTLNLLPDVTLVRCGGHFPGSSVLHWARGAEGHGVVCSGDTLMVAMERKTLTFMRSYPNFIPLSAKLVQGIGAALEPFQFDRIYGHHFNKVIDRHAKQVLRQSVRRYVDAVSGKYEHD